MIDLEDVYFHVPIIPQHRKFLRFAFRDEGYQYWILPFDRSLSPHTFTKCSMHEMDAAPAPLRLRGICVLNYINDCLILVHSEHLAVRHQNVVLTQLEAGIEAELQEE